MEVPNWVWDELRLRTKGDGGLLIALAIFRHGGGRNAEAFPREGIEHRARVRTTLTDLAKMAGVVVRTAGPAVAELKELGMLDVSTPDTKDRRRSYSIPYEWEKGAEIAHRPGAARAEFSGDPGATAAERADFAGSPDSSRARANGGGGSSSSSSQTLEYEDLITTTTEIPREQILRAVRALNVDSISSVISNHGWANLYGALRVLHRAMVETVIANPAGYLVRTLERSDVFDAPEDGSFLDELAEPRTRTGRLKDQRWASPFPGLKL